VYYTGPNLSCSQITTGNNFEDILIKIDQKLCATLGDYTTYNKYCLDDSVAITSEKEFVEAISQYVCTLNTTLTTFTDETFVEYQDTVDERFEDIEVPAITCATASVTAADTLQTVLNKYCTKITALDTHTSLSGVNWDLVYSVVDPTTVGGGFTSLLTQLATLKSTVDGLGSASLPTFNNTGSCLPTPGAADSTVDTINKIKTRLCQTPVFDINALTWGCLTKPTSTTIDLQSAFQTVLTKLDDYVKNKLTFSGDFDVVATDGGDPCDGLTVSLADSPTLDRFVASNALDSSPGTLADKITAGTGITVDFLTTPGQMILSSTAVSANDKVKSHSADPTAGFLDAKVTGATHSSGVGITAVANLTSHQVVFTPTVNLNTLASKLLETIGEDSILSSLLCEIMRACPSPCAAPSNVTVTFVSGTTTTTTTTTTTAP
jgi:hypothetical protein